MFPSKESKKRNHPNFDFFNYCGITRPVKIYTTPEAYVADVALTSEVDGTTAQVAYEIETVGEGEPQICIRTRNGEVVAQGTGAKGTLTIENVTLWQPLKAYLYEVQVTFGEDVYVMTYGVRTVKVEGGKFLINGQPFYFKGYGKHEDTFPAGRGLNLPL